MKLYFIYDVVSSSVSRTLTFPSDDTCLRFLDSAFRVPNSPFLLNVKDTVLVEVAEIDEENLSLDVNTTSNLRNEIDVCSEYTGNIVHKTFNGRRVTGYDDLVDKIVGGKDDKNKK